MKKGSNRLIIFTRYPEPGKTKTRLIPALGPEGAADLHRQMSKHIMIWARQLGSLSGVSLEVRFDGGNTELIRQWLGLGSDILCFEQGEGDLGVRMARAFEEAFRVGMDKVILIGTDCPGITDPLVRTAFKALQHSEVILGPAKDGGYYLIGLQRPITQLFEEIPWGTGEVLLKTLKITADLKLRVFLLETLDDVDRLVDLPIWEKFINDKAAKKDLQCISVIIPTLDEEKTIAKSLASTQNALNVERIVVDGGSQDRTLEIALAWGAKVLTSPTGRARQMNAGAEAASGDFFIFLHADTCLPVGFDGYVRQILVQPSVAAGAFEFRLDATSPGLQIIERVANWRSRHMQMPYGDQAIFVRAALFREIGGFTDMSIMEDFKFIRRLQKKGEIRIAPLPAITSARRWQTQGLWRTTLINQALIVAYHLGLGPFRMHRFARQDQRPSYHKGKEKGKDDTRSK